MYSRDGIDRLLVNVIREMNPIYESHRAIINKMEKIRALRDRVNDDCIELFDYWLERVFIPFYRYSHPVRYMNKMDDIVLALSFHETYEGLLKHCWNIILIEDSLLVKYLDEIRQYAKDIGTFQMYTYEFIERFH